jgi:F420H(2)-dependent quinone reductase
MGVPVFGQEHVDRYRETDGEEGHDWHGTTVLLLTTTGRHSGAKRTTPLIYQRHGDDYLVHDADVLVAAILPRWSAVSVRWRRG